MAEQRTPSTGHIHSRVLTATYAQTCSQPREGRHSCHAKSQEGCTWEQSEQPGAVGGRFLVSRGWGCKELSLVPCDDLEGWDGGHCEGSSRGRRYWYT